MDLVAETCLAYTRRTGEDDATTARVVERGSEETELFGASD
jgi:hypothetical protein